MRGSWVGGCTMLLACLVVFGAAACADAAEKGEPAKKKYLGLVHRGGVEVEREFNLADPKEVAELTELLQEGQVESLQAEKETNILALSWDLGLWTIVVFGLLLFVLRRLAWTPWLEATRRREQNIQQALLEAQRAREEAQRLRSQLQSEMDRAAEKVREILDEARADAQRATDEMLGKTRAEIQKERERLHREIGMARDQALQEIWNQTAQLATLVSAKAIRRQLSPDDHRRLVDEAIAELRQAGNERQREVASIQS
jgi:F-type H+-transporting ATPase subunit b